MPDQPTPPSGTLDLHKSYTARMKTERGEIVCQLHAAGAPLTVENFVNLARAGFYDGTTFHRVIPGFMAQGGDPTGTGTGGSGKRLEAEFSAVKHVRGTVSMARSSDVNSADSQFFICFAPAPHLDGQYTAFGQVVEGMELVDRIKKGEAGSGIVSAPQDRIVKMQVAADAQ
jgi:peptidylprolyl isomerase